MVRSQWNQIDEWIYQDLECVILDPELSLTHNGPIIENTLTD